jgi:hypothetical protein
MTAFSDLHMDTIVEEDELSKASQIRSQSRSATINTYDSAYEGALLNLHSSNSAATNSAQTASQKSVRQADKKTQTPTS